MKTKSLILLAVLILLVGCQKNAPEVNAKEIGDKICAATAPQIRFEMVEVELDELGLGDLPPISDFAFYSAQDGAQGSFLILCLEDSKDAAKAKTSLATYLEQEREAKASLAALYPSPAMSKELENLQNATCFTAGRVICCYAGGADKKAAAQKAFESATKGTRSP